MRELKFTEILKANKQLIKQINCFKPYNIKVLSNITCNQLSAPLAYHLMRQGLNPVISFGNYDNIVQDSFNLKDQQLIIVHYELLNVVEKKDCYVEDLSEQQFEEMAYFLERELGMILHNLSSFPCVLFDCFNANTIEISPLRKNRFAELACRLNKFVSENKGSNTYLIDTNAIFTKIGMNEALDFKLYNLSKTLYSIKYWKEYVYLVSPVLLKVSGKAKKAIIFDCDNTLWKGVIGEDGFDGIEMSQKTKTGSLYRQVQNMAVWLSKHGVLIGLCSKNNPKDVADVILNHPDMVLTNDHIVISEINWNDKVSNLKTIAETLNIGLDSLVFVDDSAFEINLIKEQLPQVVCMQVPEAIHDYPMKLGEIINTYFFFSESPADLDKTKQYKQQAQRANQKRMFTDLTDYLRSLEMEVTFGVDKAEETERVAQLTQKTNQMNVCTNRYTQAQIVGVKDSVTQSFISLRVKDKIGDSGLTGVAIVSYNDGKGVIDDFLMSCRIMGRNIEFVFMDYIMAFLNNKGCESVDAQYIASQKNKPVSDFFERCGFSIVSENEEGKKYTLKMDDYNKMSIDYIKVK